MSENPARDRVQAGAVFLDQRVPDWRQRIDRDRLDMSCPWCCVLGQIYGDYVTGLTVLDIYNSEALATEDLGFNSGWGTSAGQGQRQYVSYVDLQDAWLEEIGRAA